MFVEFGKNILGSAAQALALTKGLSKLGETSKSVGEIKQGQSTQIETARKSYDTAQETLNETRNMYKLTQEDIDKKLKEITSKLSEQHIPVRNQVIESIKNELMKEGGK